MNNQLLVSKLPVFSVSSRFLNFAKNYFSTLFFIWISLFFYTKLSRFHIGLYSANWQPDFKFFRAASVWSAHDVFSICAVAYAVFLVPYYLMRSGPSKSLLALSCLFSGCVRNPKDRQAILGLLLKFIFIPFCINGFLGHCALLNNEFLALSGNFNYKHIHFLFMNLILIFDFVPFLFGYMIESKVIDNEIYSVESTWFGWVICLMCYPPFNVATSNFLSWHSPDYLGDYLKAGSFSFWFLNFSLLVLFAGYASASVSIGFKSSNLVVRGICSSGLYGYVRHPAYVLKNAAWWVGALPLFYISWDIDKPIFFYSVACLAGWTTIYYFRAITEENHFLRCNVGYEDYMIRVPYRFIPGFY